MLADDGNEVGKVGKHDFLVLLAARCVAVAAKLTEILAARAHDIRSVEMIQTSEKCKQRCYPEKTERYRY